MATLNVGQQVVCVHKTALGRRGVITKVLPIDSKGFFKVCVLWNGSLVETKGLSVNSFKLDCGDDDEDLLQYQTHSKHTKSRAKQTTSNSNNSSKVSGRKRKLEVNEIPSQSQVFDQHSFQPIESIPQSVPVKSTANKRPFISPTVTQPSKSVTITPTALRNVTHSISENSSITSPPPAAPNSTPTFTTITPITALNQTSSSTATSSRSVLSSTSCPPPSRTRRRPTSPPSSTDCSESESSESESDTVSDEEPSDEIVYPASNR